MKYIDEYRDAEAAREYADAIRKLTTRPWQIMEVCGGQTHAIVKFGIDQLLPDMITLVHGPGCPVCVTALETIDRALEIAAQPDVIFCSFGDMLRVPGSKNNLLSVKSKGHDVRIVYSPLDAVAVAESNPDKEVVFLAVGFETTAPANAMAVYQAHQRGVKNFSVLVSHVLVPPALEAIMNDHDCAVQGFLAAGHVCTVMGYRAYLPIAARYQVPIVVTGFEPVDILQGVYMCVKQLEEGRYVVENQYTRSVRETGNSAAQEIVDKVFRVDDRSWRGIGEIPASGFSLRTEYESLNAELRYPSLNARAVEPPECISGSVLRGVAKPHECPAFGKTCTPEHPLGATMVSSEGACAAYYRYRGSELVDGPAQAV